MKLLFELANQEINVYSATLILFFRQLCYRYLISFSKVRTYNKCSNKECVLLNEFKIFPLQKMYGVFNKNLLGRICV